MWCNTLRIVLQGTDVSSESTVLSFLNTHATHTYQKYDSVP